MGNPMHHAQILGHFISSLKFSEIPSSVIDAAKRHLVDVIGVALCGSKQEMPQRARQGITAIPGSSGRIQVWGSETKFAAPYAALANGIACHALDYDDTHTAGIVHGSAVVGPVVLAMGGELETGGTEILTAFVLGWEIAARVGLAFRGTAHERGYHTTSIAGIFGAAAAAGKLLGLGEGQMVHCLGLVGSQASGINEYLINSSSSKIVHPGWAAHAGIVAAYLSRAGMTGPDSVFEGKQGLLAAYGDASRVAPEELVAGLGTDWEMERVSIKPYPCCHFLHAFIDCARALKTRGIRPSDIESIEGVVPQVEVALICEPMNLKYAPVSPYAAKFSMPYALAAALIDEKVSHDTFADEKITRPDVLNLAKRIGYRVAAANETTFPRYFPGWLKAKLTDGTVLEERIDVNLGAPENPMSRQAIDAKFCGNTQSVLPAAQSEKLLETLWSIERFTAADVNRLAALSPRVLKLA